MKISIVIPVYNEANNVHAVLEEITATIKEHKEHDFRILVGNDGSTDATAFEIQRFINDFSMGFWIHLIENIYNVGTAPTMRKLFQLAVRQNPDVVVKLDMDRDFSQREVLIKFLRQLAKSENYKKEVLAGIRMIPKNKVMTFYERVRKKMMDGFLQNKLSIHNYEPVSAGTQLYPIEVMKEVLKENVVGNFDQRWGMDILLSMLAKRLGYELVIIPIEKTNYNSDRRTDNKVKMQYDAFYKVFEDVYAKAVS